MDPDWVFVGRVDGRSIWVRSEVLVHLSPAQILALVPRAREDD